MQTDEFCANGEDLFAARYKITELLGEGGMGKVYLCLDTMLGDERLALKVLHPDLCRDEKHTKRFLREVQLTRKVTHPNIVRTFDVGTYKDRFFFTMEFAEGITLKDKIEGSPLDAQTTVQIIREICRGLAAIHEADIIHRDLKPGNVIITSQGAVKITDFGVARPGLSELTAYNEVVGSVAYMAPEIWSGKNVSPATDIYALGILTYRMITGVLPFDGEAPAEVMCKHLETKPTPPQELARETPLWLNNLIFHMLEKDPAKRPSSARQLIEKIDDKVARRSLRDDSVARPLQDPTILTGKDGGFRSAPELSSRSASHNSSDTENESQRSIEIMAKGAQIAATPLKPVLIRTSSRVNIGVVRQRAILRQSESSSRGTDFGRGDEDTSLHSLRRPGWFPMLLSSGIALFFAAALTVLALNLPARKIWAGISNESGTFAYFSVLCLVLFFYDCLLSFPLVLISCWKNSAIKNLCNWIAVSGQLFFISILMFAFYASQLETKRKERGLEFEKEKFRPVIEATVTNLLEATSFNIIGTRYAPSSDLDPLELSKVHSDGSASNAPYYVFLASFYIVILLSIRRGLAWPYGVRWPRIGVLLLFTLGMISLLGHLARSSISSVLTGDSTEFVELSLGPLMFSIEQYQLLMAAVSWAVLFFAASFIIPLLSSGRD